MKKLACALFTLLVLLASAGNSHAGATLEGSEISVTYDRVADPVVSISSAITLRPLALPTKITIALAKKVAVTGSGNEVKKGRGSWC